MNKKQQAIFDKMSENTNNIIECLSDEQAGIVASILNMPIIEYDGLNLYISEIYPGSLKLSNDIRDIAICTGKEFIEMSDDIDKSEKTTNESKITKIYKAHKDLVLYKNKNTVIQH